MCEQCTVARLNNKLEQAWTEITRLHNLISDMADELVVLRAANRLGTDPPPQADLLSEEELFEPFQRLARSYHRLVITK